MKHTSAMVAAVLLLAVGAARGESPLSELGYGLTVDAASVRAAGMGLVSLAVTDSVAVNLLAPATWRGGAKSKFSAGGLFTSNRAEDAGGAVSSDAASFSGMGLAVPIGRESFFGVTLSPFTRMDYRWRREDTGGWTRVVTGEDGRGGVSQALAALSVPLRRDMRLGLALRAVIGVVHREWSVDFPDIRADSANSSGVTVEHRFQGVGFGVSWQYMPQGQWRFGALFNNAVQPEVQYERIVDAGGVEQERVKEDLAVRYQLPLEAALGAGRMMGRHFAGAEVSWRNWGGLSEPAESAADYSDALRTSAGWEWAPEYRAFDPLWRGLVYRAGLYYQQHYIRGAAGHRAVRTALTGGVSFPYFKGRSRLDAAVEFGWMGDLTSDGVAERYLRVSLGFNHAERWFIGSKRGG